MGIIFLLLSFILIFSIFVFSYKKKEAVFTNSRLAFIKSSLIVSLLVVIFTELLSFFGVLTFNFIFLLWSVTFVISLMIFIFLIKKNGYSFKNINFDKIINFLKNETLIIKLILLLIVIVILSLFGIAFTTNNNWDSYTYHLPRVEHWIQDKNVDFFPTNNIRQLYLAPFSEYFILNLRLLSGNALFVNFVQFFSMVNCLLLASLVAKVFSLSSRGQLASFVLALTIPMGIMQATTTQADYIVSFFLISFVYFGISLVKEKRFSIGSIFFLCLSFSLGILTKSTFYVFVFFFCLMFGIYYIKLFKLKSLYILFFLILTFLLLNFSFINRNYQQFGSPLGPQKTAPYYLSNLNEEFGLKAVLSNSVKNIGLHLALPSNSWNMKIDQAIAIFHSIIGFPLNYDKTSWFGEKYKTSFILNHNTIGNFFHIILFFISLVIIFVKFKSTPRLIVFYSFSLVSGFIFFAFLLKWQPWQTRLDLPIFVCMAPLIAYALSLIKWKKINNFICIALLCITVGILFIFDPIKPVLGKNSIFLKDNSSYILGYGIAKEVELNLNKNKISNIGLILGGDSWEWQYWLLSRSRRFEYVYFHKDLINTPNFDTNFRYKALIIENSYLKNPQISELIINKDSVSEILNIGEKITLVIYNTEQDKLITY